MRQQGIRERVVFDKEKVVPLSIQVVGPRLLHIPKIRGELRRTQ
jgi:hypothetical protein